VVPQINNTEGLDRSPLSTTSNRVPVLIWSNMNRTS
jgi:hypothetical protein